MAELTLGEATGEATSEGRMVFRNSAGGISSELSITVEHPGINDGRPTNIPSIFGGRIVSEDEAVSRVIEAGGRDPETGRILQGFKSLEEAVRDAKARSNTIKIMPIPEFNR